MPTEFPLCPIAFATSPTRRVVLTGVHPMAIEPSTFRTTTPFKQHEDMVSSTVSQNGQPIMEVKVNEKEYHIWQTPRMYNGSCWASTTKTHVRCLDLTTNVHNFLGSCLAPCFKVAMRNPHKMHSKTCNFYFYPDNISHYIITLLKNVSKGF